MKKPTILFAFIFSFTLIMAETKEPCKGVKVPTNLKSVKVYFELPTYDEYVHDVVLQSLIGKTIDDEHILTESTFRKIRSNKIKAIKSNFNGDFEVITKKEAKESGISEGFIFQENILSELVSEYNSKFEQYTAFIIKDASSSAVYTLVNPSNTSEADCLVKKGQYKYEELLSLIQE